MSTHPQKDHWSQSAYHSAASFVPQLTTTVLKYLDPQPSDRILDIGCGDGSLTNQFAPAAAEVLGLDASPSFISSAKPTANTTFQLQDCTALPASIANGKWDQVFSNAALHWILRNPTTRLSTLQQIHTCLKPNGSFVFEMGGHGNVAEIQAAFTSALIHHGGLMLEQAREASPWFFPSADWMRATLRDTGFEVEVCETEYRPTKLTEEREDGSGGLEGWLRLMGAQFLEAVEEGRREVVLKDVREVLEGVVRREEDGSCWIGYVRLRAVARRK